MVVPLDLVTWYLVASPFVNYQLSHLTIFPLNLFSWYLDDIPFGPYLLSLFISENFLTLTLLEVTNLSVLLVLVSYLHTLCTQISLLIPSNISWGFLWNSGFEMIMLYIFTLVNEFTGKMVSRLWFFHLRAFLGELYDTLLSTFIYYYCCHFWVMGLINSV